MPQTTILQKKRIQQLMGSDLSPIQAHESRHPNEQLSLGRNFKLPQRENDRVYGVGGVFNKERWIQTRPLPGQHTSRSQLGALAGAAVVVSVLGAELGAGMGEAAHPAGRAAVVLSVETALCIKQKTFNLCPGVHSCTGGKGSCLHPTSRKKKIKNSVCKSRTS